MREVYGTVVGRWYVTLLGLGFVWQATRHLGWRRTLLYAVVATGVGAAAENGSVHAGIPYTTYAFNGALRGRELFIGDVPLMVPLSYAFMGYFGFASGRLLASGPWRTRARRAWQESLLGVILTVWALWIFDPVARLGSRWFLGELFRYRGPGFWFGLPIGSQVGFTATACVLVGMLAYLTRDEPSVAVAEWRRHPHLLALVTYHCQVAWLAAVALVLGAGALGGSAVLMWVPAAAVTAVAWSNARPAVPGDAPAGVASPEVAPAGVAPAGVASPEVAPADVAPADVAHR